MRLKTSNLWIDHQSLFFLNYFFKLTNHIKYGLFWILKKNKYIKFLNLKFFNDLFWKVCSSNISLEVHHLRLFIFLMPYRPLDGVKTITNTSQTDFISISGYIGPHTCTVVHLCSISMISIYKLCISVCS